MHLQLATVHALTIIYGFSSPGRFPVDHEVAARLFLVSKTQEERRHKRFNLFLADSSSCNKQTYFNDIVACSLVCLLACCVLTPASTGHESAWKNDDLL